MIPRLPEGYTARGARYPEDVDAAAELYTDCDLADVGAKRAWPGYIPYAISKAGVVMLTRGLAAALAPRIQVNAVGPGAVLLPENSPRETKKRLQAKIPMGRLGHPDDVAAAVRFFATCPDYITGQVLYVDGGATAV